VLVPPQVHPKLIEWKKQRVRVRLLKGVRVVVVDPPRGLTATELLATALAISAATWELQRQGIIGGGSKGTWWQQGAGELNEIDPWAVTNIQNWPKMIGL
jgi:hypothetical protein